MDVWWESGTGEAVVCDAGMRGCPICSGTPPERRRFDLVVSYKYWQLFSLFGFVRNRQYSRVCSNCHNALNELIPKAELDSMLQGKKDPIPLLLRKGWMAWVALCVVGIGVAFYLSDQKSKDVAKHLASPRVGQIYLADLSKISNGYPSQPAYGPMKLVRIGNDGYHFVTARFSYDKKRGVDHDLSKMKSDSYYDTEDEDVVTREELTRLGNSGVIYDFVE